MLTSSKKLMHGLPLFPLPDFFLFPGAVAPLHVFEPRYRQMVTDLLDTSGRLVLAAYRRDGARVEAGPAVMPVGGLGEIVQHETLADGRFLVWVLGLGRVDLSEVPSNRLYRKADVRLIADREPNHPTEQELMPLLSAAIRTRAPRGRQIKGELPLGLLADILLNALPLEADLTATIFAERCPEQRARMALEWHTEY